VAPAGPDSVDAVKTGQFDNESYIGIVVVVGPTGNIDNDISHSNVLGVGTIVTKQV
jgi:hypothetical protein